MSLVILRNVILEAQRPTRGLGRQGLRPPPLVSDATARATAGANESCTINRKRDSVPVKITQKIGSRSQQPPRPSSRRNSITEDSGRRTGIAGNSGATARPHDTAQTVVPVTETAVLAF